MSKCTLCIRETQETCPECGGTGYKLPKTTPSTLIDKEVESILGNAISVNMTIPECVKAGDKAKDLLLQAFNYHLRSILDEVIGEDGVITGEMRPQGYPTYDLTESYRNELRKEQRQRAAKYLSGKETK